MTGRRVEGLFSGLLSTFERRLVLIGAVVVLALLVSALIAGWLLGGVDGWGDRTIVPTVLDVLLLLGIAGLLIVKRRVAKSLLDERRITRSMDAAASLPEGTVAGALEISREAPQGTSAALAARAEHRVAESLTQGGNLSGQVGRTLDRWLGRSIKVLVVMAVVVGVMTVTAPDRSRAALVGLATPVAHLTGPMLPPLVVAPGDADVPRGEPVQLLITATGRARVLVRWQATGELPDSSFVSIEAGRGTFLLDAISAETLYSIESEDGARTEAYTLRPTDPLFITRLSVEVTYPGYLGRAPEELRDPLPPLILPVGSRLRVSGSATRELGSAALTSGSDDARGVGVSLDVSGRNFELEWVPRASGVYGWEFTDLSGTASEVTPSPLELLLVADSVPQIEILLPEPEAVLPMSLMQPLVIEGRDDYGLRELELVAYRATATGERTEPTSQRLDLGGTAAIVAQPMLDVSDWDLLPGDTIRYWARVVDTSPQRHEARTVEYVLRMPLASELRRGAQEQIDSAAARL